MTTVMTPSTITAGQIGKLQELLGAGLRKSGIPSEATQTVIEQQGDLLVGDMLSALRSRVEANSAMIVRHTTVNRTRPPQEALKATGRKQYVTDSVVATMPKGEGETTEVVFFKLDLKGGYLSNEELAKEYEKRGLNPADPYSLSAMNEADPAFADTHPNVTHWKNAQGKWCYAAFSRWYVDRYVYVGQSDDGWRDGWWFAGSRKLALNT